MSDANIEAHGRGEHKAEPKWSCPVCLLDWATLIHRDLNIPLFDKERLASAKKKLDSGSLALRQLDWDDG